jgi:hypothetical protein
MNNAATHMNRGDHLKNSMSGASKRPVLIQFMHVGDESLESYINENQLLDDFLSGSMCTIDLCGCAH